VRGSGVLSKFLELDPCFYTTYRCSWSLCVYDLLNDLRGWYCEVQVTIVLLCVGYGVYMRSAESLIELLYIWLILPIIACGERFDMLCCCCRVLGTATTFCAWTCGMVCLLMCGLWSHSRLTGIHGDRGRRMTVVPGANRASLEHARGIGFFWFFAG